MKTTPATHIIKHAALALLLLLLATAAAASNPPPGQATAGRVVHLWFQENDFEQVRLLLNQLPRQDLIILRQVISERPDISGIWREGSACRVRELTSLLVLMQDLLGELKFDLVVMGKMVRQVSGAGICSTWVFQPDRGEEFIVSLDQHTAGWWDTAREGQRVRLFMTTVDGQGHHPVKIERMP